MGYSAAVLSRAKEKQATSYEEPEGPPIPMHGFRGIDYATDYWNRDQSEFLGVPDELETAGPGVNTAYMTGFGAVAAPAIIGTAVAGPIGGAVGAVVGGLFHDNKDPGRLNTNARAAAEAAAGNAAALQFLGQRGNLLPPGPVPGLDPTIDTETSIGPWATTTAQKDAATKYAAIKGGAGGVAVGPNPYGSGGVAGSPNQVIPATLSVASLTSGGGLVPLALIGLAALVLSRRGGGRRYRRNGSRRRRRR